MSCPCKKCYGPFSAHLASYTCTLRKYVLVAFTKLVLCIWLYVAIPTVIYYYVCTCNQLIGSLKIKLFTDVSSCVVCMSTTCILCSTNSFRPKPAPQGHETVHEEHPLPEPGRGRAGDQRVGGVCRAAPAEEHD